ncbi:MAG: hypothetical protein DMF56_11785 [Acidobacteria bacterium]|nr:MAG: hypothetical protein DMF56_11785 [Acidobacteriota bacterium]
MSTYAEAARHLDSDDAVTREDVRRWIDSGDLLTWGAVYELTRSHPELLGDDSIDFSRRYLLRCIEENPPGGDYLHGGYEAAWELAACLKKWRSNKVLRGIATDLDKLYRSGDHAMRNRILCGVLEHAFEDAAVRPFFASWERDEGLREAYRLAMEWGAAHEE